MRTPIKTCLWTAMMLSVLMLIGCGGEPEPEPVDTAEPVMPVDTTAQTAAVAKLNLNTASEEEFLTIPGVGERMVHEFEEYRPYVSIQQFRREIGKYVDEDQVAAYEQYVYVPIDPNASDAETLQQIPGVDPTEAADLVAARPYASSDAFLEQLSGYVTDEERAVARTYLVTQ